MNNQTKILITGGGTAGHVIPTLAIIDALQKKANIKILYVGLRNGPEREIIQKEDIDFTGIWAGKLRRYFSFQNFLDIFKTIIGIFQSFFIILKFKPNAIFAKGGFVSVPVAFAGWILRKPTLLHESDSEIGIANRILLRFSKKIALGFPVEVYKNLPARKIVFTGNPVRAEFCDKNREHARKAFNLTEKLPVLLVMGGSQGARKINDVTFEILTRLLSQFQIIHIAGKLDFQKFESFYQEMPEILKINYKVFDFIDNISEAMISSDIVISRAGANSMFEIAACKKPVILIPLEGHQENNAMVFSSEGAGVMIRNCDLNSSKLLENIINLWHDSDKRKFMSQKINEFFTPQSSEQIADLILELTK